jgi:predicted lipid carrier protein YhbT
LKQPPFSPVLLAGFAMPPIGDGVLERALNLMGRHIWKRHQRNFERLKALPCRDFLIDPVDLPFVVSLVFEDDGPKMRVLRQTDASEGNAIIRGPFKALLEMAEGKVDGDALFFSRDLEIQGDTEAVVALRNAIDDADMDLVTEFLSVLGPLAKPARAVGDTALGLADRAINDFESLQKAILAPVLPRLSAQAGQIDDMDERISTIEKSLAKKKKKASSI